MTTSGDSAPTLPGKICTIPECDAKHLAKGYCKRHYYQVQRGATPPGEAVSQYTNEINVCAASDCETEFKQRAWGSHRAYCSRACGDRAAKRVQRASGWIPPHKRETQPRCSVEGCGGASFSWGMCVMHYNRAKLHGEPGEATPRRARNGMSEWRLNREGYMRRSVNGAPELQHRTIMEERLGRALWPDENVHHKNGDRADNRIENLELWSSAQPAGQRVADKIAFAREILALYADLPDEAL